MIQVKEALAIVAENSSNRTAQKVTLLKAVGSILAETVYSPIIMSPSRQSMVDGYAFVHSERHQYDIINTLQNGNHSNIKLKDNETVRILKGDFVPHNADVVVMEDHVMANEKSILITNMPNRFENIFSKSEKIDKGKVAFEANTLVTEATIVALASLGIREIMIYEKPKVAILATGIEGEKHEEIGVKDKIYENNSSMLEEAMRTMGIKKTKIFRVKDNLKSVKKVLKILFEKYDIVLISDGDFDFVKESLRESDVQELFYKINQQPEESLFFGIKNETLVFGLQGNPASILTNLYAYVFPAIRNRMGFSDIHLPKLS
jgi:molybdopterin molybdotransferase